MRRLLCILLCLLFLPVMAFAMTAEEWAAVATHRMTSSATLYSLTVNETTDANGGLIADWEMNPYSSIAAGTLVKTGSVCRYATNFIEIDYLHGSSVYTGYVLRECVGSLGGGGGDGSSWVDYSSSFDISLAGEEGEEPVPVTLLTLGTVWSEVRLDGDPVWVPSAKLVFETKAPEGKVFARISASRTGKATMHLKAKAKSPVMGKCPTGRLVLVLEYGKKYCKVRCDDLTGYVLTSALSFYPRENEYQSLAVISRNGKTFSKGKDKINIREKASSKSRILGDYVLGTRCTVLSVGDEWTEIEAAGWHAFIQNKYLTPIEEEPQQ